MAFGGIVGKNTTTYTDEEIQQLVATATSGNLVYKHGSYIGTGAYGADNPTTIEVGGDVIYMLIVDNGQDYNPATITQGGLSGLFYMKGMTKCTVHTTRGSSNQTGTNSIRQANEQFIFDIGYGSGNPGAQMNYQDITYSWYALIIPNT